MRSVVVLVAVVVVSALLPPGDLFGASPVQAQTTELCDTASVEQFTDVQAADYAAQYILCMKALELSRGFGDGAYGATRDLNRGQMASFLIRLWTDTLDNQCPEGSDSPFVDIAGDTHEANINCLYDLGITKGTTATTYGPTDPLKASQISRFLLRIYHKTDNTCPTGGDNELDQAVNCLQALRVIPTTTEGSSTAPVNRAQMAVYVIGLWHNLAGRGLPPTPPQKSTTPQPPSATPHFTMISAGWKHSCGIRTDGTAVCWGYNFWGQADAPTGKFTTLTAASDNSCGIRADGTAICWGNNFWGDPPPGKFTTITTGSEHSCGIRTDGTVVCWGDNTYGQTDAPTGKFTTITTSSDHSCGIRTDHTAICWGNNNGPGTFDEESREWTPSYAGQADAPTGKFTTITTGTYLSCGIRTDGTVVCWGDNTYGQTDAPTGKFTTITTSSDHSCGIRTDHTAICWGNNNGPGTFDEESREWTPSYAGQADAPTGKFTTITTGTYLSCGIRTDGTVVCWGDNTYGQTDAPTGKFTTITTSSDHSCGIRTDHTAICWGNNDDWQADVPSGNEFTTIS